MAQDYAFCPTSPDAVLPGVLGLLPQGPAWDAASVAGTTQNQFWRAISTVVGGVVADLCAFRLELFCSTATSSLDQWNTEYAIGTATDTCDVYANSLCAKVTAEGGQSCSFFEATMAAIGYSIACVDITSFNDTLPIAGCMFAGGCQLGPVGVPLSAADCLSLCLYGPGHDHPFPEYWPAGTSTAGLLCAVPGSSLGIESDCCAYAGYFELPPAIAPVIVASSAVCTNEQVFTYAVPVRSGSSLGGCAIGDSTGNFLRYTGYSYHFGVVLDLAASAALHTRLGLPTAPTAAAASCFLNTIKPAHTVLDLVTV